MDHYLYLIHCYFIAMVVIQVIGVAKLQLPSAVIADLISFIKNAPERTSVINHSSSPTLIDSASADSPILSSNIYLSHVLR